MQHTAQAVSASRQLHQMCKYSHKPWCATGKSGQEFVTTKFILTTHLCFPTVTGCVEEPIPDQIQVLRFLNNCWIKHYDRYISECNTSVIKVPPTFRSMN